MINLIVGKIDKYIISLENVLNRLPNDELVVIPIDFDGLMELVIRGHPIELGRVLATLVSFDQSQRSGNYPWSAQEIELLIEHLETRLFHDSEWLDAIIENPEPLTVNYAYYRLLRSFSEDPEPFRLSVDHIQGQLSTFQQNRPDNTTKTLEYIQTLHKSREFLSRINSKNVILYNSNLTTVSETLTEIDFLLLTYHQDLEKEMFGQADEELALRILERDQIRSGRPQPQLRPLPPLAPASFERSCGEGCKCYICTISIKGTDDGLSCFEVAMIRLKRWNVKATYHPEAEKLFFTSLELLPDALKIEIWAMRKKLMQFFPNNQFEVACFLLQHGPLKTSRLPGHERQFLQWICQIVRNVKDGDAEKLIALTWASVSTLERFNFIEVNQDRPTLQEKYRKLRIDKP